MENGERPNDDARVISMGEAAKVTTEQVIVPAATPPAESQLSWSTLLRSLARKITRLLRIAWIFIVPLGVLATLSIALLVLPQGKDVVVLARDGRLTMFAACFAMAFMAFALWYLSRLLAYAHEDTLNRALLLQQHLPRFIGSLCFNLVLLGQLRSGAFGVEIGSWPAIALLALVSPFWYMLLHKAGAWIAKLPLRVPSRVGPDDQHRVLYWRVRRTLALLSILLLTGIVLASGKVAIVVILGHLLAQFAFQIYVAGRSDWMKALGGEGVFARLAKNWKLIKFVNGAFAPFVQRYLSVNRYLLRPIDVRHASFRLEAELSFFGPFFFLGVALFGLFIYAMTDVQVAMDMGSLAVVLLGLTFITVFLFICEITYRIKGVNVFAFLILFAVLAGPFGEPHYVSLVEVEPKGIQTLDERPTLKQYFTDWYEQHRVEIDGTEGIYPMIYVLADGGASRSGYWVATVLGRLEDRTMGTFSRHLFCLSGASGGSVGNGTFYALLQESARQAKPDSSFEASARNILKGDLLSFTLARMLGTDVVNLICPPISLPDRARALERSLEQAAVSAGFDSAFVRTFTDIQRTAERSDPLPPILCINATRMQDGRPAAISTVRVEADIFNGRLDVLSLLPHDRDMHLSTAMVTGARFPYVSPAGRIDDKLNKVHYLVDGGYFDNSGAGMVLEMIQWIDHLMPLVVDSAHLARLQPFVIHISNSGHVEPEQTDINPVVNDLAAPIKTLIGAYGMQTDINDQRLENYLKLRYPSDLEVEGRQSGDHYVDIQLFRDTANYDSYPMNWVISERMRKRMDDRLDNHRKLDTLLHWMNNGFTGRQPVSLPNAWATSSGEPSSAREMLQTDYNRLPEKEKRQLFAPNIQQAVLEKDTISFHKR